MLPLAGVLTGGFESNGLSQVFVPVRLIAMGKVVLALSGTEPSRDVTHCVPISCALTSNMQTLFVFTTLIPTTEVHVEELLAEHPDPDKTPDLFNPSMVNA
jgi:hypothetical protein